MNRLHRIFTTLIIMSLGLIAVYAQEGMSIAGEIKMMPTDNDARIGDTRVWDQNNTLCALIKVVTTANYLTFDNGELGIVKAEQKKKQSEWWVYVPEGTEKLKITHPQYGQLNTNTEDGFTHFAPLEKATVYRLELRTPQMDELEQIDREGFLILETQPVGAQVSIIRYGEEVYKGETPLQQEFHYGSYTYVISKSGYRDEEGVLVIDQDQVILTKNMIPLINVSQADSSQVSGKLQIITKPYFAEISVDNIPLGTTPRTLHLPVGEYEVMLSKQGYDTLYRHVNIAADSLTLIDEQLMLQEEARPSVEVQITDDEFEKYRAEREQEELEKHRLEFEQLRQKEAQEKAEAERRAAEERLKAEKERQKAERRAERLKILSAPIQPRFESLVQANFTYVQSDIDMNVGLNYIAGWRFNKTLYLGAGIGVALDAINRGYDCGYTYVYDRVAQTETILGGSQWNFPLFAHMRAYISGAKPVQFFFGLSSGYIFESDSQVEICRQDYHYKTLESQYSCYNGSSFFVAPGLGINIRLNSKVGFDISASYQGKWQKSVYYYPDNMYENKWLSGFTFSLGVSF